MRFSYLKIFCFFFHGVNKEGDDFICLCFGAYMQIFAESSDVIVDFKFGFTMKYMMILQLSVAILFLF